MVEKSNVPEIRFAGFADPWEQRKLGELADIVGGGTPDTNNEKYWGGDIDWYSPAELDSSIYVEKSLRRITDEGLLSCAARMLPANKTILFTSRAGIGNTAILRRSACTNQGFQSLVVQDGTDVYFIYSMSSKIKKWAEAKASGSTFLEISGRQLGTMQIAVPSSHEQRQIGQLFSRLDALITLHQRKHNNTDIEHATGEMRESTQMMSTPVSGSVYEPTDSDIDPYLAFYLSPTLGATHQLLNGDVTPHILVGILAEFHGNVCAVQLTGMNDLRHRPFVAHDIPPPSGTIRIPTPE